MMQAKESQVGGRDQIYDVLPELVDMDRVYAVSNDARNEIKNSLDCGLGIIPIIVFYGGALSCIPRRSNVLRYICGNLKYVYRRLREISFSSWMDHRVYRAIMNSDFTYCRIGDQTAFSPERLLELSTFVRQRKRVAMTKKLMAENEKRYSEGLDIDKRAAIKDKVNKRVNLFIEMIKDIGFV